MSKPSRKDKGKQIFPGCKSLGFADSKPVSTCVAGMTIVDSLAA
jgi:hypothetical protein